MRPFLWFSNTVLRKSGEGSNSTVCFLYSSYLMAKKMMMQRWEIWHVFIKRNALGKVSYFYQIVVGAQVWKGDVNYTPYKGTQVIFKQILNFWLAFFKKNSKNWLGGVYDKNWPFLSRKCLSLAQKIGQELLWCFQPRHVSFFRRKIAFFRHI